MCLLYVNVRMNMYVMFLLRQRRLNKLIIIILAQIEYLCKDYRENNLTFSQTVCVMLADIYCTSCCMHETIVIL